MLIRRNILVFHLGALGDFILTWPLALALARLHPQSRLIYITHGQKGELAERALNLESADIEHGWHHLYGDAGTLPPAGRKLLDGAQAIYSFIASAPWTENVRRLAPAARLHCLDARPPKDFAAHATEHLLSQLAGEPAVHEATRQLLHALRSNGINRARLPDQAESSIVIHPGSGSPEKCWPAEKFLELATRLRRSGRDVRIILGETEVERWPAQRIESFSAVAEIRRPRSYLDLLAELSAADRFLGNDSGPSHLAGILGLHTYCLFGPTSPAVWHPLGPCVRVLAQHPLDSLHVDQVHEWLLMDKSQVAEIRDDPR